MVGCGGLWWAVQVYGICRKIDSISSKSSEICTIIQLWGINGYQSTTSRNGRLVPCMNSLALQALTLEEGSNRESATTSKPGRYYHDFIIGLPRSSSLICKGNCIPIWKVGEMITENELIRVNIGARCLVEYPQL